jgi:hypothetical protein
MTSMAILQSFKKYFSHPAATIAVFILAVIVLNTWQLVLPNFHFDNSFSVAAAKNVAEGHGYTTRQVLPEDLSEIIYEPINKWPPGYSWLLAAIMKVSGVHAITAVYVVNAIAIVCLLAGIYLTLRALGFPAYATNCFILFAGFFPYPFLGAWFADLTAVGLFMLGIGLIMHANASDRHLLLKATIAALLCGYSIFLKYLYLPVAILPLVVWGWHSLRIKRRARFNAALAGSAIVMTSAILLLLYQSRHSGQPVYVNPTGKGFFPEHIFEMGALIPASLLDQDFMTIQLARVLNIEYHTAARMLKIINYFLLLGLFVWVFKWWRKKWIGHLYGYIVLAVTIATTALLLFLSLVFAPYVTEFTPFWTYLEELRYYAIVIVFIQQGIFWYFLVHKQQRKGPVFRALRVVVIMMVSVGILHGAYYLVKQAVVKQQVGTNKYNEQVDIAALEVVNKLRKQYPDLVICSNNHELANIASLSGAPVLYDYTALNPAKGWTDYPPISAVRDAADGGKKRVMVLAILRNDFIGRFQLFLLKHKPTKVDQRYNFSFYLAAIAELK